MPSYKTKCPACQRLFATKRSLEKHATKFSHQYQEREIGFFKPESTTLVNVPVAQPIPKSQELAYQTFLCGVVELINSYLNPALKSRWVKIDLIMVPVAYFQQLLMDLEQGKPFAVREKRHPAPLKCVSTAIFYNIYDKSPLVNLFADSAITLKWKAYFRNNDEVSAPPSAVGNLSTREKVALARQRAGSRWGVQAGVDGVVKATARRSLICTEGEWPRTREFQLIWWPDIFSVSHHGHLQLRFFIEHVELSN